MVIHVLLFLQRKLVFESIDGSVVYVIGGEQVGIIALST